MRKLTSQFNSKNQASTVERDKRRRLEREKAQKAKQKRQEQDQSQEESLMMADVLVTQIAALEATLVTRYGENFAENLAAEFLDEDIYKNLMSIKDKEERRHAIAIALSEGVAAGTIDPENIGADPELLQWIEAHVELKQQRQMSAEQNLVSKHELKASPLVTAKLDAIFD